MTSTYQQQIILYPRTIYAFHGGFQSHCPSLLMWDLVFFKTEWWFDSFKKCRGQWLPGVGLEVGWEVGLDKRKFGVDGNGLYIKYHAGISSGRWDGNWRCWLELPRQISLKREQTQLEHAPLPLSFFISTWVLEAVVKTEQTSYHCEATSTWERRQSRKQKESGSLMASWSLFSTPGWPTSFVLKLFKPLLFRFLSLIAKHSS